MAKLLTTKGIGFFIDELFKSSNEFIYIVTPYIKIDAQLNERISDALDRGMQITLIYGKDKSQLKSLKLASKINIYFYENLHAKFYINEKNVLITSMNMYTYSEANNREIGVLFSKKENSDATIFEDCIREFESIRKQSIKVDNNFDHETNYQRSNTKIEFISKSEEFIYKSKYFPIVKSIIIDKLGVDEIEVVPNANFVNDLGADSLDCVELIMEFEKEFNIVIPDDETEKLYSIAQTIEYFELKQPNINIRPYGFCIRTGVSIPFNVEKPLSYNAYKKWNVFGDPDYPEKFCHFSGEPATDETCVNRPILKKNWKKAKEIFDL